MAKGIPTRRFRSVLWGDPRHGRFGAERLEAARELCGADGGGPGLRAWSVGRAGLGTTPWGHREAEGHGGVGSRGVMPNAWGRVGVDGTFREGEGRRNRS